MVGSSSCSPYLRFHHQKSVWAFPLPHTCHMHRPSHSSWFVHFGNI
jgi:hypothetical protein